jgi:hypothetical protein
MNLSAPKRHEADSLLLSIAVIVLVIAMFVVIGRQNTELENLRTENACLKHPHGESSVHATFTNGVWKVSKPVRTGC